MMECKYCGKETKQMNICSKCYDKLKVVRQIKELGQQIRKEGRRTDD